VIEQNLFSLPEDNPTPEPEEPAAVALSTREISRYVTYYKKNVRPHSLSETKGIFGAIKRLLAGSVKHGRRALEPQEIADALKNYANDPYVKSVDHRLRKHIRSFFTYETVVVWLKPIAARGQPKDVALQQMDVISQRIPAVSIPLPPTVVYDDDEPEPTSF
jgi:hypothetical protein